MKCFPFAIIVAFIIGLAVPGLGFALVTERFTITQDFRSSQALERDFSSALLDTKGRRVILPRDYQVNDASLLSLDKFSCDADALIAKFNLDRLEKNTGCKVTGQGTLVYGFMRDHSKDWVGSIYLIEGQTRRLITPSDLFVNRRSGRFIIGVKNASEYFVIYKVNKATFFEYRSGQLTQNTSEELQNLRLSNRLQVAWSGNAWFFSQSSRRLQYFDGQHLVEAYKHIPGFDVRIKRMESLIDGSGAYLSDGNSVVAVRDHGYLSSTVGESRRIRSKDRLGIVDVTLMPSEVKPAGTTLTYSISIDNGRRWFHASPFQIVTLDGSGDELLWQVFLHSSSRQVTPILTELEIRYSTRDVSLRNAPRRDRTRVRSISDVSALLTNYAEDTEAFPLSNSVLLSERQWEVLENSLLTNARSNRRSRDIRRIQSRFPEQRTGEPIENQYNYHTDPWGRGFILSTKLELGDSRKLEHDIDGTILGVNCNDPVYCVGQGQIVYDHQAFALRERLVRATGDIKVYLVKDGAKRWITTPLAFERRGFKWQNIELVTVQELNRYRTGSRLR